MFSSSSSGRRLKHFFASSILWVCLLAVCVPATVQADSRPIRLAQATGRTAATTTPPRPVNTWYGFVDPLENATIPEVINKVTRFALGMVGALFLLYFIYGGFMWMTAGGEAERVKKSRQALLQAIIGVAIVVFSYSIIGFILQLTNQLQTTRSS